VGTIDAPEMHYKIRGKEKRLFSSAGSPSDLHAIELRPAKTDEKKVSVKRRAVLFRGVLDVKSSGGTNTRGNR